MKSFSLLFALFIVSCYAQTSFVRVWFVATGEPASPSYFDYDPVAGAVLRFQTMNDQAEVNGAHNNAAITISIFYSPLPIS